jgi:Zn-dependent protease with chaperone function
MKTFSRTLGLALAAFLCASAAHADGYPRSGRAIDQLRPAANYSDVMTGRPRSLGIMRARANGFVPSPEMHDYVKSVLDRVLKGVALPPSFNPDVRILAAPEFAALCTPDGTIVVTVGLLELLDNEDELAFVLAHEVSHAIYRHHDSEWFTRSQYYMVMNGAALENITSHVSFSVGAFNTANIDRGLDAARHIYTLSQNVLAPQMTRGQEDAADALGFDLMVKAGYDSAAALAVMDKLAEQEAEAELAAKSAQKAAKQAKEKQSHGGGFGLSLGGLAFGNGDTPAQGGALNWLDLGLSLFDAAVDTMADEASSHHPAAERAQLLSAYEFRAYRDLLPAQPTPLPWAERNTAPNAKALTQLLAHYAAAENAAAYVADTSQGAPDLAADEVAHASAKPTSDHAYTQFVAAEYYDMNSRSNLSEAALLRAANGPEPSWEVYSRLIDIHMARDDWQGAQSLMDQAVLRFDNSPVLLPKRIAILHGAGDQQAAEKLLPQCDTYDIRELHDACRKAAGES